MALKEVKIELTSYCDKNCVHCSSEACKENYQELDMETVKRVIDEAILLGATDFVLTGGEATKYLDLPYVISYLKSKNVKNIKLYTMITPSKENLEFMRALKALGLSSIAYSLNLALVKQEEIHDEPIENDIVHITLSKMLQNNEISFATVKPFLKEISEFLPVSIHFCLTKLTKGDLAKLDECISELNPSNFDTLSFLRYVPHGRGDNSLTLTSAELKELKPELLNFLKKYPNKVKFGSPFNILNISYTPCTAGDSTIIIGSDGAVYPCDAMKYFDYLGSGGNIYNQSLKSIYESDYFNQVRNASTEVNESCKNCSNVYCYGGCLAQKMINMVDPHQEFITPNWYQENALRTINDFGSLANLKFNAYTGVFGEAGEFFDYMKKYYTHNLEEEKKAEIKNLASKELGDLMWYLATSLALYFDYDLKEVFDYIRRKPKSVKKTNITPDLIHELALKKDPLCPYGKSSYSVDIINNYINHYEKNTDVYTVLYNFKKTLNELDYIEEKSDSKNEAIKVVADIICAIAEIAEFMFGKKLSELLTSNIEKLKKRYPSGFDDAVANERIAANKRYKEELKMKVKNLTNKEESPSN